MISSTAAHCHRLSRQLSLFSRSFRAPARTRALNRDCRDSARQCATVTASIHGSPLARGAGLARGNSRESRETHDNATLSGFSDWCSAWRMVT